MHNIAEEVEKAPPVIGLERNGWNESLKCTHCKDNTVIGSASKEYIYMKEPTINS